jgi:hypothetical protein
VVWSIAQDDRGLLWVVTIVGDPHWARGLEPGRPELREVWRIARRNQYSDTMLEVIDPVAGRLVASVRLPQYVHLLSADGYLVGLADDFDDNPRIHVWRAWLEGAVSR